MQHIIKVSFTYHLKRLPSLGVISSSIDKVPSTMMINLRNLGEKLPNFTRLLVWFLNIIHFVLRQGSSQRVGRSWDLSRYQATCGCARVMAESEWWFRWSSNRETKSTHQDELWKSASHRCLFRGSSRGISLPRGNPTRWIFSSLVCSVSFVAGPSSCWAAWRLEKYSKTFKERNGNIERNIKKQLYCQAMKLGTSPIYGLFKLHKSMALGHLYPAETDVHWPYWPGSRNASQRPRGRVAGAMWNQVHPKSQQWAPSRMLGFQWFSKDGGTCWYQGVPCYSLFYSYCFPCSMSHILWHIKHW